MTQPYTDTELVRLAYREFRTHVYTDRYACTCGFKPGASVDWDTHVLAAVLSALAAAGRLTPADAETRPEWGWLPAGGREPAPYDRDGARWFVERGHPGTVMRRWRAVGPWLPVPEEDTDGR